MYKLFYRRGKIYLKPLGFKRRGYILLLGMPSSIHILTATLQIKSNDPSRGFKARDVVNLCSTSTWVTVPLGTITALLADIATFNAAIGAAKITAWNNINSGLKDVMDLFSAKMRADPINAREICESGGFIVKGVSNKQEQVYTLTQGTSSGTVNLVGNTVKGIAHLHDWWISTDGITFVRMRPTTDSKMLATGLIAGKRYWFQHQLITSKASTDGPLQTLYIDVL
jgi:hypothetical protein